MMTDEELDNLIREVDGQVKQLPDETKQQLNWAERKQRALVLNRARLLERIKAARVEGNIRQEARAMMEYLVLMQYGHKNVLIYNLMKARIGAWSMW